MGMYGPAPELGVFRGPPPSLSWYGRCRGHVARGPFTGAFRRVRHAAWAPPSAGAPHALGTDQPRVTTAPPVAACWLQALTARVGTRVGRLLAIARRELTAALVPVA